MSVHNFQDKTKQKHLNLNNFLKTQILPVFHEVFIYASNRPIAYFDGAMRDFIVLV